MENWVWNWVWNWLWRRVNVVELQELTVELMIILIPEDLLSKDESRIISMKTSLFAARSISP